MLCLFLVFLPKKVFKMSEKGGRMLEEKSEKCPKKGEKKEILKGLKKVINITTTVGFCTSEITMLPADNYNVH